VIAPAFQRTQANASVHHGGFLLRMFGPAHQQHKWNHAQEHYSPDVKYVDKAQQCRLLPNAPAIAFMNLATGLR